MKIVVVGQGGREHALGWRLVQEGHELVSVPGNPGLARLGRCIAVPVSDIARTVDACAAERPDLVVVGPEAPLAAGLADLLRARGIGVFGPSAAAARIEASKAFAKEIMREAGVPTARFAVARDEGAAARAIDEFGGAVAVKADGLAAGKGVVVCGEPQEARAAAREWLARGPVVIEERLCGPELSIIALTDGKAMALLPAARDHKRLLDGDRGPNTGGMGAVCPVATAAEMTEMLREQVFAPVLRALEARGHPFSGALYAGLMLDPRGLRVLEFNARFGDPETQAIVLALAPRANLGALLQAAATGTLADAELPAEGAACCVVLAARGYPEAPATGDAIEGVEEAERTGAVVFHAGTARTDGVLRTAGGRVLGVCARGLSSQEARARALEAARRVRFPGMQLRSDIGAR